MTVIQKEVSLLPARLALGSSMLYHGGTKLSSEGAAKTAQAFSQMGIKPGRFWALATGASELFAGVASILGVGTRVAALAVLVTQTVAISKVHAGNGFDVTKGGYEYNLALMGIAFGLLLAGPGRLSVHETLECAAEGRLLRKLLRKARPTRTLRLIKLLK